MGTTKSEEKKHDRKENKMLQLPDELLDKVMGGYTLDQLTNEELEHVSTLCDAYADAYATDSQSGMENIKR